MFEFDKLRMVYIQQSRHVLATHKQDILPITQITHKYIPQKRHGKASLCQPKFINAEKCFIIAQKMKNHALSYFTE